ncbi:hypothetical protein [uncultured Acinetobacter sp.]|uniref:hypothetical protein n=1 Tax=uncultured Acinetobacter sp. TaxID=165433 RepID=UPI0025889059|nr:hypothetical protein [uncultured Acinetobacter sp.]
MAEKQPDYKYQYPTDRRYADDATDTLAAGTMFDPAKTAGNYGIKDPEVAVPVPEAPLNGGA